MDELLKQIAEHFGWISPFAYAAGTYKLFSWIDKDVSDAAKKGLAKTMGLTDIKTKGAAGAVVDVFDLIYSAPLLHWKAFGRSALFTLVLTAIFIFEVRRSTLIRNLEQSADGFILARAYFATFAVNALSDYLALFIIRPWLRLAGNAPVLALTAATLLGFLSVGIGTLFRMFVSLMFFPMPLPYPPERAFHEGVPLFRFEDIFTFAVVAVVPAVAVFMWLPLLAFGILVLRLLKPLSWAVSKVQWFLAEGEKHPLKAVGFIAALTVFVISSCWQTIFGA
jgi:hypothetical protein